MVKSSMKFIFEWFREIVGHSNVKLIDIVSKRSRFTLLFVHVRAVLKPEANNLILKRPENPLNSSKMNSIPDFTFSNWFGDIFIVIVLF